MAKNTAMQKVTVEIPKAQLQKAQRATGEDTAHTIRRGVDLLAAGVRAEHPRKKPGKEVYEQLLKLEGKLNLGGVEKLLRERRGE